MNKKIGYTLMLLSFLVMIISPAIALEVTEIETKCKLFECYTILEIKDMKVEEITLYKNNLANFVTKKEAFTLDKSMNKPIENTLKMDSFVWDTKNPDLVTIRGTIDGASSNYWGIGNIWNSTWWNSTYQSKTELNISRYVLTGLTEPVFVNLTTTMNNTYGGRLIDDNENEVNYTMLRYDETGVIDWIYLTFPYNNASNLTYNWYFNATTEEDPSYLFAVFVPDDMFYDSCDWSNDFKTGDTNKYTCANGILTASAIDGVEFASDQIQTINTYGYDNITVWIYGEDHGTSSTLSYTRYLAGTRTLEATDNGYNLLTTQDNPDEFRMLINYGEGGAVDADSGVDIPVDHNFSRKVHYSIGTDDAFLFISNDSDELMYSINTTSLNEDVNYWGFYVDSTSSNEDNLIYEFLIFIGYVNPLISNRATVIQGGVEVNASEVAPTVEISNFTYTICSSNTTLLEHDAYYTNGSFSYNDTYTLCNYDCDNITYSCSPPTYVSSLYGLAIGIGFIVAFILFLRWIKRR